MSGLNSYGRHTIDQDDRDAVAEVLGGDWLTQGPKVEEFERAVAACCGAPEVVACNNGTSALHLAYAACGLGRGDVVLTSPITFLATANAARMLDADVRFADVDAHTACLDPEAVARFLAGPEGGRVKVVCAVHMAGQPADMRALAEVVRGHGIRLVEDASHALGARHPDGTPVGGAGYGELVTFSFHPVKPVTTGEGGAVAAHSAEAAAHMRKLRSHGMRRDAFVCPEESVSASGVANPWYYEMDEVGFNYRLPDINAALGVSQMRKLDTLLDRRNALAARYDALIAERLPGLAVPLARRAGVRHGWHIYVVRLDFVALGVERAAVMAGLRAAGIGTQVHYIPVHMQPYYRAHGGWGRGSFPNAERYYDQALTLPLFPRMDDDDPARVVDALARILGK